MLLNKEVGERSMKKAKIVLNKDYTIGKIEENVWGSFIEHMGRAIYTGIYEPEHELSDEQGFRKDVMELVKELDVPLIRYPGGNFVSGYDWKDGIGPKEKRKHIADLAWRQIESNEVGLHEFYDWSKKVNSNVMQTVNLGTGTPKEAGEMVEYCNFKEGTYWSDLRAKNGKKEPFNFEYWCLGNEMDGPWQICALTADEYGRKATEAAKIMKWVDPSIKLIAAGSSAPFLPTYPEWDRIILEHLYDHVDYLSLHRYYEYGEDKNLNNFLASFVDLDRFIKTLVSTVNYVKAKKRSNKQVYLSLDEWNVWHTKQDEVAEDRWKIGARRVENNFDFIDSIVLAGLICTIINNADFVKMASLAQLVNVIAPILTEPNGKAIRQTTYYPYKLARYYAKGMALNVSDHVPNIMTKYGKTPLVQSAATYDNETNEVSLFLVNIDTEEDIETTINMQGFNQARIEEFILLDHENKNSKNTFKDDGVVKPRNVKVERKMSDEWTITLPKLSFSTLTFKLENDTKKGV